MKKFYFIAFAALMLMTGCEKETAVTITDIRTKAELTGKVTYAPGYTTTDYGKNISTLDNVAAAGQTLVFEVNYSSYGYQATGKKVFETTIETDGSFTISIPVPESQSLSISDVYVRPFFVEDYADYMLNKQDVYVIVPTRAYYAGNLYFSNMVTTIEANNTYYIGKANLSASEVISE